MSLIDIARIIVPEGEFKDFSREVYHFIKFMKMRAVSNGCRLDYSFNDGISRFEFMHGPLEGTTIFFPPASFRWLSAVPKDLRGYFTQGRLAEDSIIVDAGAFPGDFTIAAAKMVPSGKLFALEPDPRNRKYLEEAVYLNGLQNVSVLPYALSDRNGTANMILNGQGSKICSPDFLEKIRREVADVKTISLDTLLAEEGALVNDRKIFVKMDIEGHEIQACVGARNTMKHGARFAIASYHIVDGQKTAIPLAKMFEDRGYEARQEYPEHLTLFAQPRM